MKTAVFAGSFDPFTLGHKDIVRRASKLFNEVIVAVALETGKNMRSADSRIKIIELSTQEFPNVKIVPFDGLLTDFMKKIGCATLVRGVRNAVDYDYEHSLWDVYRSLYPEIEIVLLPSKADLNHISSTVVRQLCKLYAPINGYVDTKAEESVRIIYQE
ncbi:MAG: pantetheine-phosphate adenylyltransferase [Clostridiales bacterium]|nr:pantetheine-phosphate adenylyltransferase [Clostridiales bacterium]